MLLWLAFGFAPAPTSLPQGAPVLHLARTPAKQWRLASSQAAQNFAATWGDPWIRWDERTGAPRFLGLSALPEGLADELVADVATLAGIDPSELRLTDTRSHAFGQGERTTLRYTRRFGGVAVIDDEVQLVVTDGRIGAAWIRITPTRGLPTPHPGEVVAADPDRGYGRLVRLSRTPTAVRAVDRAGHEVYAYDPRAFDSVTVTHEEYTVDDALVTNPAREVTVTDAAGTSEVTAADGSHTLTGQLTVELDGTTLMVLQNGASISHTGSDDIDLDAGEDLSYSAADTLHHFYQVWDWLADRWPTHRWLDERVRANVDASSGSCNAYYTGGTLTFYAAYDVCNATGRIASVIYHEVGHGIHEYILGGGTYASDVSEGSADYISATILDNATIGEGFYTDGSGVRELDTDRVYPTDVINEPHNDGLIWASFLWDLREAWRITYGEDLGIAMSDAILLGALAQGPGLTDLLEAVLVADDDDGDWSNGTPHDCELIDLLAAHGLAADAMGVYAASHIPVGPQASETLGYPVSVALQAGFESCTSVPAPTPSIWYTNDRTARLPAADGTGAAAWTMEPMTTADDVTWTTTLPRVPATDGFRYFYVLTSSDGTMSVSSHGGLEQGVWEFRVGDRAELWCDDFESGAAGFTHGAGIPIEGATGSTDEWVFGNPAGGGRFDPDVAYGGGYIATTVLDEDYSPNNAQYLSTPDVALTTPGRMRLFTYQRWLSVEDGLYDHARVYVSDGVTETALWENAATPGGGTQLIDTDWSTSDHDLAGHLGVDGVAAAPLSFSFTLQSDAGLEFGGWALDDVCVVELDDVPDHYRRVALSANWVDLGESEVGAVDVTWHTPWIRPLTLTVLVRQEGRSPESLTDGVILDLDLSPEFGEEKHVIDTLPGLERGTSWTYALFAAGEDESELYLTAVDGQNAATVSFDIRDTAEPLDTADTGDTGDSAIAADTDDGEVTEPGGCGCETTGSGTAAFGAAMAIVVSGRRQRAPSSTTTTTHRRAGPR
ncbi:MAG: hypothetical protein EXR71_00440 [Myxococcales bacterium]|nr:hypothetical protein [Myxococcales bacterium]